MIRRGAGGFSLMEVLVALGLASLVLGCVLADVGRDMVRLSRLEPNYRAMLVADAVLEKAVALHSNSSESGIKENLAYKIEAGSVQADPRVTELKATVTASNGRSVILSVYRLRSSTGGNDNVVE